MKNINISTKYEEKLFNLFIEKNIEIIFNSVFNGGAYTFLLNKSNNKPILIIDMTKQISDKDNTVSCLLLQNGNSTNLNNLNFSELIKDANISDLSINHLIWSCDILGWAEYIIRLIDSNQLKVAIYIHDFFTVCPTINLLNYQNKYCGIPNESSCNICLTSYSQNSQNKAIVDLVGYMKYIHKDQINNWREFWEKLFSRAEKIIFPSESAMKLWKRAYKCDHEKLVIMAHNLDYISEIKKHVTERVSVPSFYNVYILGDFVLQKGSQVLDRLLEIIKYKKLPICINVLGGYENDNFSETPFLKLHGRYKNDQISAIFNNSSIDCFLMLSICPETFSYTTQEMMATGLPIISFNLGAQAEFISKYDAGIICNEISAESMFSMIERLYVNKQNELINNICENKNLLKNVVLKYDKMMVENSIVSNLKMSSSQNTSKDKKILISSFLKSILKKCRIGEKH